MVAVAATQAGIEDITNERELYAWLSSQPTDLSRAMAARAALRSLPAVMNQVERTAGNVNAGASLVACLRATIVSCVATHQKDGPTTELKDAAHAATRAAPRMYPSVTDRTATLSGMSAAETVLSNSKASVADAAAQAMQLAGDTARSSTLSAGLNAFDSQATVLKDAALGSAGTDLLTTRLWSTGKAPLPLLEFWEGFVRASKTDPLWTYWVEWYQGFMGGRPLDWDFQTAVAQIDDAIWRKGAQAVAKEIERLRAAMAAAAAARAEATATAEAARAKAQAQIDAATPTSVDHLLDNRILVIAVLDGAAAALRATAPKPAANAPLVGVQAALTDMPQSLTQIAAQLRTLPVGTVTEPAKSALKSEVAKVNMAFDVLEGTLSKLNAQTCAPADLAAVAPILGNPVVLGNLVSGLLILAGPNGQLVERYEGFTNQWQSARKAA